MSTPRCICHCKIELFLSFSEKNYSPRIKRPWGRYRRQRTILCLVDHLISGWLLQNRSYRHLLNDVWCLTRLTSFKGPAQPVQLFAKNLPLTFCYWNLLASNVANQGPVSNFVNKTNYNSLRKMLWPCCGPCVINTLFTYIVWQKG